MHINIYRNGLGVAQLPLHAGVVFTKKKGAQHNITARFDVNEVLNIQEGDYIEHDGNLYFVNTIPDIETEFRDQYEVVFEAREYDTHDQLMMDEGNIDFPYFATAADHLALLINCMQEINGDWSVGIVDATEEKEIFYEDMTCWSALAKICETFKLEHAIDGTTISLLSDPTTETTLVFEKGYQKGLYKLSRTAVKDKNVLTKVYGFGGTRNIPTGYRNGAKRLVFEERFVTDFNYTNKIKVGIYKNEEIFPTREGVVGSVGPVDDDTTVFTLVDIALDFNINDHLMPGLPAKIGFTTGELTGIEYEIIKYDHGSKTIYFKDFTASDGYITPNLNRKHAPGDKYRLYDITLPQSYITANEDKLKEETLQYLAKNSKPKVTYQLTLDPLHVKRNGIVLDVDNKIRVKDTRFGIDDMIRISEVSYPLANPHLITAIVSDEVVYSTQQAQQIETVKNGRNIKNVNRVNLELARRNVVNLRELGESVFDPDGNYFTEKIKPGSIETLYLAVGAKATNFTLKDVGFQANVGGDPNVFSISPGQLVHFEVKIEGLGFTWNMSSFSTTTLLSNQAYYVYARVSRTSLTGGWVVSADIKTVESEAGFWHFQAGRLFAVQDGRRDHEFTKGMVFIIGDQITAGVLKSLDGLMFFNMNEGKFRLGDVEAGKGLRYNNDGNGSLELAGVLVQNGGGVSSPLPVFRGPYNNITTYYSGDEVTYAGSTWRFIYATPIFNVTPAEGAYWTLVSAKGDPGESGAAIQIEYSVDGASGWHSTFTEGDIYARQRTGAGAWSEAFRIVGESGADGVDGKYTSYRFAKNSSLSSAPVTGWSDAPPSLSVGEYLWMQTGHFNGDGSQIGAWSTAVRISGKDGADGQDGQDGEDGNTPNFTQFRYQKNGSTTVPPALDIEDDDPAGWLLYQEALGAAEYMWMINSLRNGSDGTMINVWSAPVRFNGEPGQDGADGADGLNGNDGAPGPFLTFSGDYNNSRSYTGSSDRLESVKYAGQFYVTRRDAGTFSGVLPTDTSKWNPYGATLDSVATGLLLASLAYIENLGVRNLKSSDSGKRFELTEATNAIRFYLANNSLGATMDDDCALETEEFISGVLQRTYGPGVQLGSGITDSNGFSSLGRKGLFTTGFLRSKGLRVVRYRGAFEGMVLNENDHYIIGQSTASSINIYLPSVAGIKNDGRIIVISNMRGAGRTYILNGNGNNIWKQGTSSSSQTVNADTVVTLLWDGTEWYMT